VREGAGEPEWDLGEVKAMAKARDVVCGMEVDTEAAPAKATHQGQTYYFCAPGCKAEFERNPEKYAGKQQ
jgi:Cu+-exporting ATPase